MLHITEMLYALILQFIFLLNKDNCLKIVYQFQSDVCTHPTAAEKALFKGY